MNIGLVMFIILAVGGVGMALYSTLKIWPYRRPGVLSKREIQNVLIWMFWICFLVDKGVPLALDMASGRPAGPVLENHFGWFGPFAIVFIVANVMLAIFASDDSTIEWRSYTHDRQGLAIAIKIEKDQQEEANTN